MVRALKNRLLIDFRQHGLLQEFCLICRVIVFRRNLVAGARNHLNLHFLSTCLRVLEQMAAGNHGDLFRTAA